MGIHIRIGNYIGSSRGGSWTPQRLGTKLLYWGKISEISGGQMPNKVTGATDYLTVAGTAGSYTFQCPNTADYIAADTDYIWFEADTTQRTPTESELVSYDIPRTPVKYDDDSPNSIREIIIFKSGETLTAHERDHLFVYMFLSVMWDDSWNDFGHLKSNKPLSEQYLYPWDGDAKNLFARLLVKGETPSDARKLAINTAIKSLKAADLFATQFDVLVVTRGTGPYTRKENWIKDSSHALAVPNGGTLTETDDVGIHSDGTKSSLRTQFIPSTNGVLYKKDDACFLIKISGTIGNGYHGVFSTAGNAAIYTGGGANSCMNDNLDGTIAPVAGYSCMSRYDSTHWHALVNAGISTNTKTSLGLPTRESYILALNNAGTIGNFCPVTQVVELYAKGKSISQAKFLEFQTIMDTYFASL